MQKQMLFIAVTALSCASTVWANPVSVPFSTTGSGPLSFYADTFSESGSSGSLNLDTTAPTTNVINSATLNVGYSGGANDSTPLILSFDLTLDGVTHTLTQNATWAITPSVDWVQAFAALSPILFETASGAWDVTLNPFYIEARSVGSFSASVSADFNPVPEPAMLALIGLGLAGLAASRRRKQ